jgi:hypothetical protein
MDKKTLKIKLEDTLQGLRDEFRIGCWIPEGLSGPDLQIRAVQQACYEHLFRRLVTELSDDLGMELVPVVMPWEEPPPPERPSAYDAALAINVQQTPDA